MLSKNLGYWLLLSKGCSRGGLSRWVHAERGASSTRVHGFIFTTP